MTIADLAVGEAFAILLVFARVGAAMMFLPGFGEASVNPRARLMIAMGLSITLAPLLRSRLPAMPDSPAMLAAYIKRQVDGRVVRVYASQESRLQPGDTVVVRERYF